MINVGDTVELKGVVKTTGTGTFDVEITEINVEGKLQKFQPVKNMSIATADYLATDLTASELALVKKLATANKANAQLTEDERFAANSIAVKLP
jgi:hypothetical protein